MMLKIYNILIISWGRGTSNKCVVISEQKSAGKGTFSQIDADRADRE